MTPSALIIEALKREIAHGAETYTDPSDFAK